MLPPRGVEAEPRGVSEPATRVAADATADEASEPIPRGVREVRAKSADVDATFAPETGGVCGVCGEGGTLSPGSTPAGGQRAASFLGGGLSLVPAAAGTLEVAGVRWDAAR